MRFFVSILILVVPIGLSLPARGAGTLEFELRVDPQKLAFVKVNEAYRLELPGYRASAPPGQAALPARVIRLALPAGADPASLQVEVVDLGPVVEIPLGGRVLALGKPVRELRGGRTLPPGSFPRLIPGSARLTATGRLGNVVIAEFTHRPVSLDPAGDRLKVHTRQLLRLRFGRTARPGAVPAAHRLAESLVDNPEQLASFYRRPRQPLRPGLAIVTTEDFVSRSGSLESYIRAKEQLGFEVYLVTEEDYGSVLGQPPNQRPQRIRGWLKQNQEALGIEYVLMLGNPHPTDGQLPMMLCYPYPPWETEYGVEFPTDVYYSDLSGNWDLDGDGRYGEYDDDRGPGGVDFYPEVMVGRIPVYSDVPAADLLLDRAAAYATAGAGTDWRRKILLPGAILFFDEAAPHQPEEGAGIHSYLANELAGLGFSSTTLYEAEGSAPSKYESDLPLSEDNLIEEWNRAYGLVYWIGHGDPDAVYRMVGNHTYWENIPFMRSSQAARLPAGRPAFVYHGSCSNGTPERSDNIGAAQLATGAIASFASTRLGLGNWGEQGWEPDEVNPDIFNIGYQVMSRLGAGQTAGQAISETRALLSDEWWQVYSWHSKFSIVLYGDPTLSLYVCESDPDCDDGLVCNGTDACVMGLCQSLEDQVDCSHLDGPCRSGVCVEATLQCQPDPRENGLECDDLSWCTFSDVCQDGECVGVPRDCNDYDPCTADVCDGEARECLHPFADDAVCDDGMFCTQDDRCEQGICQGTPKVCPQSDNPCQENRCNESTNRCELHDIDDGAACLIEGNTGKCKDGRCQKDTGGCGCAAPGAGQMFSWLALLMLAVGLLRLRTS